MRTSAPTRSRVRCTVEVIGLAAFLVVALFVFSVINCTVIETVRANTKDGPNALQFGRGLECTQTVWLDHYLAWW